MTTETFQRDEYKALANEFGGLAGWYAKQNGGWSKEAVVDALLRLYENRDLLEGVEGREERGLVALSAFAEDEVDMAERKFSER